MTIRRKVFFDKILDYLFWSDKKGDNMDFTYKELALLNEMISVALLSGQIEFSEEAKTVYKKVTTMLNEESRIGGGVGDVDF